MEEREGVSGNGKGNFVMAAFSSVSGCAGNTVSFCFKTLQRAVTPILRGALEKKGEAISNGGKLETSPCNGLWWMLFNKD